MNAQSKFTNFKKFGLVLAAAAFVSFAGDASAQNRNGRSGHFNIVVTHGSAPSNFGSSFRHQQRQGPFADMPQRQRRAIRWLADKRPQWHVRMSNEYPRRYTNRVQPLLRSLPVSWQNRMHNRNSSWYHANVGRGHRLVTNNTGHGRNGRNGGQNTGHGGGTGHGGTGHGGNGNQHGGHVINHTGGNAGHTNVSQHAGTNGCGLNAGTAIGAALGGFAGSQFGSGSGTLAATAAGTFLGAMFGSSAGCR